MSVSGVSTRWGMGLAFVTVGLMLLLHTTGVVDLGSVIRWAPSLFILLGIVMMVAQPLPPSSRPGNDHRDCGGRAVGSVGLWCGGDMARAAHIDRPRHSDGTGVEAEDRGMYALARRTTTWTFPP